MSNWNGKLKCIKSFGRILTKGKVYEVVNGKYFYDDGDSSKAYLNYRDFIEKNAFTSELLEEVTTMPTNNETWGVKHSNLAIYITINDEVTIAIPSNTPMGIAVTHPDDEYDEEIGEALALKRLYEEVIL